MEINKIPIPHHYQRVETVMLCNCKANMLMLNSKKANLCAAKKERIQLPISDDGYRISEFLSHPFGIQAMLNTKTLENFEPIDANTYRCFLPKVQLLNFEAAPVLDLRVTPTEEDCTVEMLSCKFQGSEIMERQNEYFSAFMMNRLTWSTNESKPFLEADMKLNVTLEIYTAPFTLLPASAVEGPGNLMMQALVDRLIKLLLKQLMQDYYEWENQQIVDDEFLDSLLGLKPSVFLVERENLPPKLFNGFLYSYYRKLT
eukprot:XP_015575395.1 uncharacterized protein LOC8277769 isoform X2 [Ricinus communis]